MKKIKFLFSLIGFILLITISNKVYAETKTSNQDLIEDGIYSIHSGINDNFVLDILDSSLQSGANLRLYQNLKTLNQKFNIKSIGNGYYTITAVHSKKVLDVANAGKTAGTNVWQCWENNADAQKWMIKDAGNGYYYLISKCNGLFLDVANGIATNGTNIQVCYGNNSKAQKFKLNNEISEDNNNQIGTKTIEDGLYEINTSLDAKKTISAASRSKTAGTNVEINQRIDSNSQKVNVKYLGDGYYTLTFAHSKMALDVANAGKTAGTNVWQCWDNKSDAQKWIIKEATNGYYYIISKCNGLYLDVANGIASNGNNIQVCYGNNSKAQMFKFNKTTMSTEIIGTKTIEDGLYEIETGIDSTKAIDVANGTRISGGNVQICSKNNANCQKVNVKYIGNGYYKLTFLHSNMVLDVANGKVENHTNVWQCLQNESDAQKWIINEDVNGYYNIVSKLGYKFLTIANGKNVNGTNIEIDASNNSNSQRFKFNKTEANYSISIDTNKYPGYKEKIDALMQAHPNWNFELLYTGLNFEDVTSGECKVHSRNLVPSSNSGEWICPVCGTRLYDSGLYCASEKAVAYYMDPRNFLDENNIFQFEKLNIYESSVHTIEGIRKKVNGTFLENYADDINTACRNKNVNPYYIVARLIQEQGTKGSKIGTGMDGGDGKTYYNPFNIGASGNGYTQIYNNALNKAKSYGWDTMEKALEGGIDFLKKNWLENYQNTLYQNKFDIDTRNGTSLYTHQYMQHIMGAYSEAKTLKSMYSQINCLEGYFTFIIPVYENMNATPAPMPSNTSEASSINVRVNANGGLKLRSDANTNSDTIEIIPNGTILLSVQRGINDNWNKVITLDGKIGFMSGNYLQVIDTIKNCNYTARVKTNDGSGCKVRVGPSTKLDKITTLTDWTVVTVIEKGTYNNINGYDWCRIITDDGRQGYMPLKYLI